MTVDCHVHIAATRPSRGRMSPRLINSFAFRFMRWRMGLDPTADTFDDDVEAHLVRALNDTPALDAAVVLAFDAVYARDGTLDWPNISIRQLPNHAFSIGPPSSIDASARTAR